MKKLLVLFLIFASCEKETCVECTETKSKYQTIYCGTENQCNKFIVELRKADPNLTWFCR